MKSAPFISPRLSKLIKRVIRILDSQGRGSRSRLAEELGIDRTTLNYYLREGREPGAEVTLALQEWAAKQ